jgi:hypothetical protein
VRPRILLRGVQLAVAFALCAASAVAQAQPSCNTGGWPTNSSCICDVPWQSLSGGDTCAMGQVCDRSSGWGTCIYYPSCNNGGWPTQAACLCDVPWQSQQPGNICQPNQVCDHGSGNCSGGSTGGGGGGSSYPSCNTGGWPTNDACICDMPWQSLQGGDVCQSQQVCDRSGTWGTCSGGTGGGGGGGGGAGDNSSQPAFGGQVANLDPAAAARAGFDWFEIGYPDQASSTYQTLASGGVRVFAYINSAEVSNDYIQDKINAVLGYSWRNLAQLGFNAQWNTTIIDVRQSEWQRWLLARGEEAYGLGARGIKWDVANYEDLYRQHGYGPTEAQQAADAMYGTMAELKRRHPDLKQVVNQGFALAEQHPDVVAGLEVEDMVQGAMWSSDPGMNQWFSEMQARWTAIHNSYGTPILMAEYADPSSGTAASLESQIEAWGLTPYITSSGWNIEGRGLHIVPPW